MQLPRRWPQWLLKLLLSFLLLGLVFRSIEPTVFWKTTRSIDIKLLSLAIMLYFPGQLLAAYRWYYLLKHLGRALPFWSVLRHNTLGQLSTLFLPGQISGDVVRTIAAAHGQPGKTTFALSVIVDKMALLVAVATFALVGIWGSAPVSQFVGVYRAVLGLVLVALPILVFLCRYRTDQLPHRLTLIGDRLPFARQSVMHLAEWLSLPCLSLCTVLVVLAQGFALQLAYTAGSYVVARSMGITISPSDWAAINAIVALVQVLPLTIGGLGVREGLFAGILALYQVPIAQSTAVSLTGFGLMAFLLVGTWLILESTTCKTWFTLFRANRVRR